MIESEPIFIKKSDFELLRRLVSEQGDSAVAELLEQELARALVVSDDRLPEGVVALGSRARIRDEETRSEREITLVPPQQAVGGSGSISVLAPLGAAVLGLSEGESIAWPMSPGKRRRFRVLEVLRRPFTASGRSGRAGRRSERSRRS